MRAGLTTEVGGAASVTPRPLNHELSMVLTAVLLMALATELAAAAFAVLAMMSVALTWTDAADTLKTMDSTPSLAKVN